MFFAFWNLQAQQKPENFISHKVKKRETIFGITRSYNITEKQLIEYNPLVEKVGLRKRMLLRIPVYNQQIKEVVVPELTSEDKSTQKYIVKSKETKWRIAYNFKITISELEALNPKIKEGLKEGQQILVPVATSLTVSQSWNSDYNYYRVRPMDGYYRIEKKIGVTQLVLDSLNPQLSELGLQAGMVLRVPGEAKGEFKIDNDLLVEKLSLLDSINEFKAVKLSVLLPFKANEIEYDSIEDTQKLLKNRNLHTISAEFYSGVILAADTLSKIGIQVKLNIFDTENSV
jgi:LysM repeat protein